MVRHIARYILILSLLVLTGSVVQAQSGNEDVDQVTTYGYEQYRKTLLEKGLPSTIVDISVQLAMEYDKALGEGATEQQLNAIVTSYQVQFDLASRSGGVYALASTTSSTRNLAACCVNGGKNTFGYSGGSSWISDVYWTKPNGVNGHTIGDGSCTGTCTGLQHIVSNPVPGTAMNYNITYVTGSSPYFIYHDFGCY